MADRGSQYVFGVLFDTLVEELPLEQAKKVARKLWPLQFEFDFHIGDSECDEALIKLGLAKMGPNRDYPEDGDLVWYMNEKMTKFQDPCR